MNRRFTLTAAACLLCALTPSSALSQAKPAAPASQPPPAPAKWVPPVKGQASVEMVQSKPQRVGTEIQTALKVRNTSKGSIALLTVEELWYNTKREIATNGRYVHRKLLNPGEIVEFTLHSPIKPDIYTNMFTFKHAYGGVDVTKVPKFK